EDDELLQYEAQKEAEATEHMANTGKQEAPPGWEPLPGDSGDGQVWVLPTLEEVSRIHETSLSDYQVRDLNDEINKLMREKYMWEVQIRNLGGPNYMRGGTKMYDEAGREIPGGGKGYRYFGRAKELPG
ncbi:hypothetical protein BN1708_016784, partial [Verticillium longisporum]